MTKIELPVYELTVNDEDAFVDFIALVENPAIEVEFLAFANQEKYAFALDEDKKELIGAAMIPDQMIFRRNDKGEEFNVFFSKDTIRQIVQSFFKSGYQSNMNIEHSATNADSFIFQSMIVDKAKGISFMDLPDGSWVVGVKVLNDEVWADIKAGKRKGFSVEGIFETMRNKFKSDAEEENEIILLLQKLQKLLIDNI